MKERLVYFIMLFIFVLTITAGAEKYLYVDANAVGTGSGTQEEPYKTIAAAINSATGTHLVTEDVSILIKPGIYSESIVFPPKPADHKLTITAEDPLNMPVMEGNASYYYAFKIESVVPNVFNDIEISNLIIRNYRRWAIYSSRVYNLTIKDNIVYNNGYGPNGGDGEGHGISVNSGYNINISNNLSYNNGPQVAEYYLGNGIVIFGSFDSTLSNNVTYDNEGNGSLIECSYYVDFDGNSSNYDYTQYSFGCGGLWIDDGLGSTVKDSLFVNDFIGLFMSNEDHNWTNGYTFDDNIVKDNYYGTLATSFNPKEPTFDELRRRYNIDYKDNNRYQGLNKGYDSYISTSNPNYVEKTTECTVNSLADTVYVGRDGQSLSNPIALTTSTTNPHHGFAEVPTYNDKHRFIVFNNDQTTDFTRYLRIKDYTETYNTDTTLDDKKVAWLRAVIDGTVMTAVVEDIDKAYDPVSMKPEMTRSFYYDGADVVTTYHFNVDVTFRENLYYDGLPNSYNATYTIKKDTDLIIRIVNYTDPAPTPGVYPTATPDPAVNLVLNNRFVHGDTDWTFTLSTSTPIPAATLTANGYGAHIDITNGGDSPTDILLYQSNIPVTFDQDYYVSFTGWLYHATGAEQKTAEIGFWTDGASNTLLESHTITLTKTPQRFEFHLDNQTQGLNSIILAFHLGGSTDDVKLKDIVFKESEKTYFVGPNGSDTLSGYGRSSVLPYASIDHALDQALLAATNEPVTVKVLDGEYDEVLTFNGVTPQYPVTLRGEKGVVANELTILNGKLDGTENDYAIDITNSKNIVIYDMVFKNYKTAALNVAYSEDIVIDKVVVYDCGYASAYADQNGYGIDARYSNNITIQNSLLYNNGPTTIDFSRDIIGAAINTVSLKDSNILKNSAYSNNGGGILVKSGLNVLLDTNTVNNHDLGMAGQLENLWKYSGIGIDGGDNIVMEYNMVNSNNFGIALSDVDAELPSSYTLRYNKLLNNGSGIKIIGLKESGATGYDNITLTENDFGGNTIDQDDSISIMLDKTAITVDSSSLLLNNTSVTSSNGLVIESDTLGLAKVRSNITNATDYIEISHGYYNDFSISPTITKADGYTITIVQNGVVYQKAITDQNPGFDDITIAYAYNDLEDLTFYEITFPAYDLVIYEYDNPAASASITVTAGSVLKFGNTNKISNYHFNDGTDPLNGWQSYIHTSAAYATVNGVDKEVYVDVYNPGSEGWNIQLYMDNLTFTAGKKYTVAFEARTKRELESDPPLTRLIDVYVCQSADPYTPLSQTFSPDLSETMEHFNFSFVPTSTVSGRQLEFDLGGRVGDVIIDNVVIIEE